MPGFGLQQTPRYPMTHLLRAPLVAASLAALVPLAGCGDDDTSPSDDPIGDDNAVTLVFGASADGNDFACGTTFDGLGTSDASLTISDLRFYLHDIALRDADGTWVDLDVEDDGTWQSGGVALIDLADLTPPCDTAHGNEPIRDYVTGRIAAGDYDAVRFTLGVPFERNHEDASTAQAPLSYTSMFWSWQAGYKFVRIDGALGSGEGWRFHLGSTACQGTVGDISSCGNPNRPTVEVVGFDPDSDRIDLDIAALLAGSDPEAEFAPFPRGCMSEPDNGGCPTVLDAIGLGDGPATAFIVREGIQ